jgi:beta-galactosidase
MLDAVPISDNPKHLVSALALFAVVITGACSLAEDKLSLCEDWRFIRADVREASQVAFDDSGWERVSLPHSARLEPLVTGPGAPQWQGLCWYRKAFALPACASAQQVTLRFEGAMNAAQVYVNGLPAGHFEGGYLPYVMDISSLVRAPGSNIVAVCLDNRDNPLTGPKPLASLDFNLYSGIYRKASLTLKDKLHITDSILAGQVAGGGVFVTFRAVSKAEAVVQIQTHVKNDGSAPRRCSVRATIVDASGHEVGTQESEPGDISAGSDKASVQRIRLAAPRLWSPQTPNLYQVRTEVVEAGRVVDSAVTRFGIRSLRIDTSGFWLNGERMFLRGANRHQEYPYIGNALSDDAQYRDARKIKEAGFDYVRLSHYPQSPAFLDACDELGLVVMDCLMGWQYFNPDPAFTQLKWKECRQMVRRDRNHPCVVLWEVSLNESAMPPAFVRGANAAAHEEYPGDQCYTCGWAEGYDVFMQARQHGGCRQVRECPCLISEYGDWEYFAQDAGLEQEKWKQLQPSERSSRQLRGDGEQRLVQQALNFQEAHNDNLKTPAFGDGLWVMFDYNRGYADEVESSGVMDLFRLPKFGYWFFRSQRDADERVAGAPTGPTVFIANYWSPDSPLEVRVFSNCEEIGLFLNDRLVQRRLPDSTRASSQLKHPPFTFSLERFEPGTLRAVGYIQGREAASHERRTPGPPAELDVKLDTSGRPFAAHGKDMAFCYAELKDRAGTVIPTTQVPVFYGACGDVGLAGENPVLAEAGTATILAQSQTAQPAGAVFALCLLKEQGQTRVLAGALSLSGSGPHYEIHYTLNGSEPTAASPVFQSALPEHAEIKAAIVFRGQVVARADSRSTAASIANRPASGMARAALP